MFRFAHESAINCLASAMVADTSPIHRRYIADTSPIHRRYIADTSPIHRRYIADTSPRLFCGKMSRQISMQSAMLSRCFAMQQNTCDARRPSAMHRRCIGDVFSDVWRSAKKSIASTSAIIADGSGT